MCERLTRVLFSRRLAVATSLLYAFPVTPATVVSPYTEPIYAAALFSALFCSVTGQHVVAALLFAVTTSIRATGVLSCVILASHVLFAKCASPKSLGVSDKVCTLLIIQDVSTAHHQDGFALFTRLRSLSGFSSLQLLRDVRAGRRAPMVQPPAAPVLQLGSARVLVCQNRGRNLF